MDKWKEILIQLNDLVESKELKAAVKAGNFSGEFEPSKEGIDVIKEQLGKLYNYDSAVSNPEIIEAINKDNYPKHKKTAMKFVEDKLKPIFAKLDIDLSDKEYVADGLHDLDDRIEGLLSKKTGKSDDETQKLINSYKEDIKKANELLSLKDSEWNEKYTARENEYSTKELRNAYKLKAKEYKWADAYADTEIQDAILDKKWDKITAKAHLKLSDDGNLMVFQKDMPDKEIYEGTKKVTFQTLFEPEIDSFLKKSNPQPVQGLQNPQAITPTDLTPRQQQMIDQRKQFMGTN